MAALTRVVGELRQTLLMAIFGRGRRAAAPAASSVNSLDASTNRPAPHPVLGRQFTNRRYWEDASRPGGGYYGAASSNVGRAHAIGMTMDNLIKGS